jgi:hypothetical protein
MGTSGSFFAGKAAGAEADYSPPLVPMLRMDVSTLQSPMYFYGVYLTGGQDQVHIY